MKAWDRMVENHRFPTKKETLSLELLAQQDVQTLSPEERRRRNKERYRRRNKAQIHEQYERKKARETPEEREKRLAYAREYYHAHKQLKRPKKED